MKTRSILPFAVLGLFLVALFASACPDDGFDADQFGGTYSFGENRNTVDKIKFEMEKKDDFEFYKDNGLSLSKATQLTENSFKESIMASRAANVRFPENEMQERYDNVIDKQKYNYVIHVGGNIIVAEWGDDVDLEKVLSGGVCSSTDFTPQKPRRMINWFPEDSGDGQSPCWLGSKMEKGLLDAISKHLMLAQGVDKNGKGATIGDFNVDKWATNDEGDWMKAKVAYAGELIVDLASCTYTLNNDSGTYGRPNGDELENVAKYFDDELGVGPVSYVKFFKFPDESREIRATENLSTKISDAPPWCP